jgi:hypothetical protein
MALGDLQNDWSFARRFVRTNLSTKMMIALFGSTATHDADGFREPEVKSVKMV